MMATLIRFVVETNAWAQTDNKYIACFVRSVYAEALHRKALSFSFAPMDGVTQYKRNDLVRENDRFYREALRYGNAAAVVYCLDRDRANKDRARIDKIQAFINEKTGYRRVLFARHIEEVFAPKKVGSKMETAAQEQMEPASVYREPKFAQPLQAVLTSDIPCSNLRLVLDSIIKTETN